MVSFRIFNSSNSASLQVPSSDPDASTSSTSSGSAAEAAGPPTPAGEEKATGVAAAGSGSSGSKYWPTQEEVDAVRLLLSEQDREACDTAMANRYLRATGGDQRHAAKRIRDTLTWRREERPEHTVCTACVEDPKSHYMQVVGHDLLGRPLIYSCMALATNRDVEDNRKHMVSTFEQAIRLMPPPQQQQQQQQQAQPALQQAQAQQGEQQGEQQQQQPQLHHSLPGQQQQQQQRRRPVESWCWVMDFHGFSLRDCDPRLARIFLNLSAAHYPERLGTFFIVSAPTVFNTLWRAISAFIDPVTKQKIHFVNFSPKDNSKLEGLLRRYFAPPTAAWLLREMADNRQKGLALTKAYSYPDLSNLAAAGLEAAHVAQAQQVRRAASSCRQHDHLGSPAFLEHVEGNPDLLLPHLQQLSLGGGQQP